jgi:hypothetical protein
LTREPYTPSAQLRLDMWLAAKTYEETGDPEQLAKERAIHAELERRELAGHCEACGYDGSSCGCGDNLSPVLVNEYERGEVASA